MEGKRKAILFVIVCLTILIKGCISTHKLYEGSTRPKEEIAIVKVRSPIFLYSCDGYRYGFSDSPLGSDIHLLPGTHYLGVTYQQSHAVSIDARTTRVTTFYSESDVSISFDAKPGHIYYVCYTITTSAWRPYIEDITNKSKWCKP